MPASRTKPIQDTLEDVKKTGQYYRIVPKGDAFSNSRVKISSLKNAFEKNENTVYSPATHLTGLRDDIVAFLEARVENSDTSAEQVLKDFQNDKKLITSANYTKPAAQNHVDEVTRTHDTYSKDNPRQSHPDIPIDRLVEIYETARETRKDIRGSKGNKGEALRAIISQLEGTTDQAVRIHGFTSNGLVNGKALKVVSLSNIAKTAKPLGDSEPLKHFYIQPQSANRQYVKNFLTYYYTHVEKLDDSTARVSEETDKVIPEKKTGVRARTGRSVSPQSASSKTSRKPSTKKSASRAPSVAFSKSSSSRASSSHSSHSSRSSSPASSEAASEHSASSTVFTKGTLRKGRTSSPAASDRSSSASVSSRASTPKKDRSASPRSTSPKSTSPPRTKTTRTIRRPGRA